MPQHGPVTDPLSHNRPTEILLTVAEAAAMLSLSRSTLYNLMDRGELTYVRIGRTRRILRAELDRLIRESLVGPERFGEFGAHRP